MPGVDEAQFAKNEMAADLAAGVDAISFDQTVEFVQYTKVILPIDGSVFWVKSNLLSESALLNAARYNALAYNQGPILLTAAPTATVKGSLHWETTKSQEEDQTLATNVVIFTSLQEVTDFNAVGPNTMFIATVGAENVRYAFSRRQRFYRQADLFHYVGTALYPALASQIVDDPAQFNQAEPVVSNSLPLWLALNTLTLPPGGLYCPVQLYSSFLVPDNLEPPYGVVHIFPDGTQALQGAPLLGRTLGHDQLVQDRVRITLYGLRNAEALTFQDVVNFYSENFDRLGMMNMPIVRDEKRTQVEFGILAQKKTIDYDVSYLQSTVRNVARQLIESAIPSYIVRAV